MNKRIQVLFIVCLIGSLLITAVSRTLFAASQPAQIELVSIVQIEGPRTAVAGIPYTFTATASPPIPPITYVWQVDGQTITQTGGSVDTLAVSWMSLGQQPITVTASNGGGAATAVRVINVLPPATHTDGVADVYATLRPGQAIVGNANGSVFGPHICTWYGDPFSPLNNPYVPAPHTYRYRIQIPASYPYEVVRVELFDSDSMNRANPTSPVTIYRTQAAIDAGLSPTTTGTCTNNRKDACLIPTGELALVDNGTLELEEINPYWFWRIDENRGAGSPPGNGTCSQPSIYNPLFNTATHFALHYYQDGGAEPVRVELAAYTGQTGDGVRDNGDHDTDMRWVSPGAAPAYDQPVFVPTDPGSPGDFEIHLTDETPGIVVDSVTGDRYLYLDITSLSGASENGFEIWAGPPVYTATVPSDVNLRNVYLLDHPAAHNTFGVTVYARDYRPTNSNLNRVVDTPLAYLPPSATFVTVSMFDSDAGAQPPITFFFDTIPASEWAMTFGVSGVPDPDGQVRNCRPGSCDNTWIAPPYQLTLPANFPGGRLMARYRAGYGDTYAWEVKLHPEPTSLTLSGPVTGTVDITYDFQATVANPTIAEPLTYTWQATDLPPQIQTGYLTNDVTFNWQYGGVKTVMVTAVNRYGSVTTTHQITIAEPTVIPPTNIQLSAPATAVTGETITITAALTPPTSTLPLTYTWQADDQPPLVQMGGITDTAVYSWTIPGPKIITVTAENTAGSVTAVHTLTIEPLLPDLTVLGAPQLVTPLPVGAGLPVSFTVTIANNGDADVDTLFFVDVFLDPTVVLTTGIPITESSGFTAVPALAAGESLTLTILAPLGFAELPPTHTVYAMVDSLDGIAESDETNNVSASLTVTDVRPLLAGVTIFGPALGLTGETYTFTAVVTPTTISDPITYTWFLDDTPTLTMTNGTAVPISLTFPVTGTFDLLVMASHGFNTVTDTHTIVITDTPTVDLAVVGAPHLLTPGWIRPEQPVSFTVTIANVGNVPITGPIQTDIFLHPAIVLSDSIPITQSQGFMVVDGLAVGETAVLTFTIPAGFAPGPLYRQVYAMVDSLQVIAEADESDNVSLPLDVLVGWPLYLPVVFKP